MNIEIYSYSVLASILGILIVFLSLCALSLLMVGLKVAFSDRPKVKSNPKPLDENSHDWIMAAVAVFLSEEEAEMEHPSAEAWTPRLSEKSDRWMNLLTFVKNN